MTEVDKLKKLLDSAAIKGIEDLEDKLGSEIYEACIRVLKENAVNDMAAVDLNRMTTGMALGIAAVMKQVLPQVSRVESVFLCMTLISKLSDLLRGIASERE